MKKILILLTLITSSILLSPAVLAISATDACNQVQASGTAVCDNSNPTDGKVVAKNILSVMFWILGSLAIIVIIASGIMFVTAAGNPQSISRAKNALVYSIVGLVVAVMAYAIVNFIVDKI